MSKGKIVKGIIKASKAFANTAKQYLKGFNKSKPAQKKFPEMSVRDKKFFNPDGSSKTGDLYASARDRAAKEVSNFKPLVTGNKVYDTKRVNDAFAKRFGKPSAPKPKEVKYQKRYHENEILEPTSGYYRTDAKGWPLPSQLHGGNKLAAKAAKLKAAREITGPKGL